MGTPGGCPPAAGPKPPWLKRRLPQGEAYGRVQALIARGRLHTVCQEARCPNLWECYARNTATFLILGDRCTRDCRFCAVASGPPAPPDPGEPERVARAAAAMGLSYVVITSVTRDDLADGGAAHFAATIAAVRRLLPQARVEVLIPDFQGRPEALLTVIRAAPDVINHNVETVPRLYPQVRPQADYRRSLEVLSRVAASGIPAKSGLMLGLGERAAEVRSVLEELRRAGCRILTLGQYLQPSPAHLPVAAWVPPGEFAAWRRLALAIGFAEVASAPLVRSSYRAERSFEALGR